MSIASIVSQVAPSAADRYPRTTAKGIKALEDRERNGVAKILAFAEAKGADLDEVRAFLTDLGATMPEPPAPAQPSHSDPVVAGLLDFARSKGYQG